MLLRRFFGWLVIAVIMVGNLEARSATIEVGMATADISPPLGYRMAGYFSERFNTGTIDPLYAKAIVFRQGTETAAIVVCDLIEIPREIALKIRQAASIASGIPAKSIAVAATHSHTGPLFHGILRDKFHTEAIAAHGEDAAEPLDYPDFLTSKVVEAIQEAKSRAIPARLDTGTAEETRIAFNRRFHMKDGPVRFNPGLQNPQIDHVAGPIDPEVGLILVRPEHGGEPLGLFTVFALHLDTVSGTLYSGDYPAILQSRLQEPFGSKFISIFGNGTCGDINHVDVTKTTVAKTKAIGDALAETVVRAIPKLESIKEPLLAVASQEIQVPVQKVNDADISKAEALLAQFDHAKIPMLDIVRAVTVMDLAKNFREPTTPLEVQAFRLGKDTAIVTIPGEVFVEHGLAIKQGSPFAKTFVIELANGNPSYIPTQKAFREGSYEIVNSRVESGGGEKMVEGAIRLLKQLSKR